ncbi:protein artichoke [Anopheles darlingi]|uniref:protein artichoke n=1 Tax=Anopheles darlingi TaxID=43151 RepID=UPI002100142F|nr:protein artichoke [Anopheles darlingi]XP_049538482.1 protein artichoke [Anopheles darlingi]XP_049538483.1 protein artichoke [Anopheles darlingi]
MNYQRWLGGSGLGLMLGFCTLWLSLLVLPSAHAEYIPPGPKYKCPEKPKLFYPCVCTHGTDDGIFIQCENSNLASLSVAFINLASTNVPIEKLHLKRCKIKNLFGTLLHKLPVKHLHIIDTPLVTIADHAFYGINDTLQELHIVHSEMTEFPSDALKILGLLKVLIIDGHRIEILPKGALGGAHFEGTLEKLHFINGPLGELGQDVFSNMKKVKTLDLHGNQLTALKKGQFKGMREVEVLDLSYNNLTKLDATHVSDLTKMTWCNVSNNALTEITRGTFARNTVLRVVNMASNAIRKIDANTFRGMRFLRRLYLNDNMISDVGRGTFGSVTRIGSIDLARNRIKKVDFQMFFQLNYVELINLAENEITEIQKDAFKDLYLTHINISHNRLETIEPKSFINCANMTVLDLSHNLIRSIPRTAFDETTYATEWIMTHNLLTNMTQLPLSNMTGLKILNVSYNNLVDVPKNTFPKLYELHTIDLSFNNISHIYNAVFQNLLSLRNLNLSHNSLEKIGPSTFGTLHTLLEMDLSHNQLRDIARGALAKITGLRFLHMHHNKLEKLFQIPISLNELDLAHNEIAEVPEKTWPTMNSLLVLNLSNNRLANNLGRGSFAGLLTMQRLMLESNGISEIPRDSFADLGTMQYLYLDHNNITILPKGAFGSLPILFELQITNNGLEQVMERAFDGLLQLLTLNMSHNVVRTVPNGAFLGLVSLRRLDLSNNLITTIDNKTHGLLEDCLSLEELNLSHNRISSLTRKTFPSNPYIPYRLRSVDLSYNSMAIITNDLKIGTATVHHLNLSHNNIKEVRPGVLGNLTSLRTLDLSYNELTKVDNEVFNMPLNFTALYLHHNKLWNVSYDSLLRLDNLTMLDLRANELTRFESPVVRRMKSINLTVAMGENPLHCDCFLRPLFHHLRSLPSIGESYRELTCATPASLANDRVTNVTDELLVCVPAVEDDAYRPLPDLRFREIAFYRGQLIVNWFVAATSDVADFYVYIRDRANRIIVERTVAYSSRSTAIDGTDIRPQGDPQLELCVLAKSSDGAINFLDSQCVPLPEDLDAIQRKYHAQYNYKLPLSLSKNGAKSGASCDTRTLLSFRRVTLACLAALALVATSMLRTL